jgi:DNA helicase-2/ATP-dependent DNA helicase PcrA
LKQYIKLIEECKDILGKEQTLESLVEVIGHINDDLLLHKFFGKTKDSEDRLENINELKMLILEHEDDSDELVDDMTQDLTPFGKFLATAALTGKVRDKGSNAVTLTTIHSSKGLEWPVVFIPNCVQSSLNNCKDEEEIEEARRVFFVAGTRAKALLYMSHPEEIERYSGTVAQQPLDMLTSASVAKCTTSVNSKFPKLSQAQFTEYAKFLGRLVPLADKTPSFSSAFNLMQIENAKNINKRKNSFQSPVIAKKAASDENLPPSKKSYK